MKINAARTLNSQSSNFAAVAEEDYIPVDRIYLSHGPGMEYPPALIDEVIEVCEDIRNGNVDGQPFDSKRKNVHIAKAVESETKKRLDGKLGNIVYNEERI